MTSDRSSDFVETLQRVDPESGELVEAEIGDNPHDVVFGLGDVWVASGGDAGSVKTVIPRAVR